ncbi:MAG: glutaredoxin family protein [Chloroflexi bacterium]|nr:glutaredoxin family protein [Chloroflexota bacterium]
MKEFLSQRGIPYIEKNISENADWRAELEDLGFLAVPVTVIGDRYLQGFKPDELEAALSAVHR